MRWCLSWWTPEGPMLALVALVFWAAVIAAAVLTWRRVRRTHGSDGSGTPEQREYAGSGERGSR